MPLVPCRLQAVCQLPVTMSGWEPQSATRQTPPSQGWPDWELNLYHIDLWEMRKILTVAGGIQRQVEGDLSPPIEIKKDPMVCYGQNQLIAGVYTY